MCVSASDLPLRRASSSRCTWSATLIRGLFRQWARRWLGRRWHRPASAARQTPHHHEGGHHQEPEQRAAELVRQLRIPREVIDRVAATETVELERRERLYRGDRPASPIEGRVVILVVTVAVILATLVLQATTLGAVLRRVRTSDRSEEEEQDEVLAAVASGAERAVRWRITRPVRPCGKRRARPRGRVWLAGASADAAAP